MHSIFLLNYRSRRKKSSFFLSTSTLLWQEDSLDVGKNTTLGNGNTGKKLVQFFVIPDGQPKMPRDDARLLIVPSSVTSKLQDLCGQIFHDCRHVDWSTSSNSLGIVSLPEQPVDPAHWELKSSPTGARLCLSLDLTTLSAPRHLNQRGCKKSLKKCYQAV